MLNYNCIFLPSFTNSVLDTSLFIMRRGHSLVYLLVYVNDILIAGNDPQLLQKTLLSLTNQFSVKDYEPLHYFLGIEARHTNSCLHLSKHK